MSKDIKIYSKLDYEPAVKIKKHLLITQMKFLNTIQNMRDYKELRKQEFMIKEKLKNNLKEIKNSLKKEIEKAPKTDGIKLKKPLNEKIKESEKEYKEIENQLREIKEKLENISK